jgi:hypothetical protein
MAVAKEVFPGLTVNYVKTFNSLPVIQSRGDWFNDLEDVESFRDYLVQRYAQSTKLSGVAIVQKSIDRANFPGTDRRLRSGADRRTISAGFQKLIENVSQHRKDTTVVSLESLPFRRQLEMLVGADTLIAQHGAAFVHAHWMPKGGHLIELQCSRRHQCPQFVQTIAGIGVPRSEYLKGADAHPGWPQRRREPARKIARQTTTLDLKIISLFADLARDSGSMEAKQWLTEPVKRTRQLLPKFRTPKASLCFVETLYAAGAESVTAAGIYPNSNRKEFPDWLVIKLPKTRSARQTIRKICEEWFRTKGNEIEPEEDIGEREMLLRL